MESQPQNPEFRINSENFHPCNEHVFKLSRTSSKKEKLFYNTESSPSFFCSGSSLSGGGNKAGTGSFKKEWSKSWVEDHLNLSSLSRHLCNK